MTWMRPALLCCLLLAVPVWREWHSLFIISARCRVQLPQLWHSRAAMVCLTFALSPCLSFVCQISQVVILTAAVTLLFGSTSASSNTNTGTNWVMGLQLDESISPARLYFSENLNFRVSYFAIGR